MYSERGHQSDKRIDAFFPYYTFMCIKKAVSFVVEKEKTDMKEIEKIQNLIKNGETVLGIELGSTRIKGVLLNLENKLLATGEHSWENRFENGIWTYHEDDIWKGLRACYLELKKNIMETYGVELEQVGAIGISAMMHGYLAFDKDNNLLVPFRTWRNTLTQPASEALSKLFEYQIPQRWSVAHLYQAILNNEEHVKEITFFTTLAGYVHWKLTGKKVLGIDDASGMFPINSETKTYYEEMLEKFNMLVADKKYSWKIAEILPQPLVAGQMAGKLTAEGAKLLDPDGRLKEGIPLCPPEGDAGTGMVATNSVQVRTGNVSAGTSVFSMIVLEKKLSKVYPEIDIVTTPEGNSVAMVHCNNCTSDLNAWVSVFKEFCESFDIDVDMDTLYGKLYRKALEGDKDCGGLLAYNYFSGEHITHFTEGRPLFVREQNSKFTLSNFMRTHLFTSLGAIKVGNDLLLGEEGVKIDVIWGHGGLFKTEGVAQKFLAAALNTPVSVMKTAGEGGAWGIAVLASYMIMKKEDESLSNHLQNRVFREVESIRVEPDAADVEGFKIFINRYKDGLTIERAAVENIK